MAMAAVYTDAMERCYCDKHRRELCHECCLAFGVVNRMREVECGARQAPSEAMELANTKVMLERGIAYIRKQPPSKAFRSNLAYHKAEMKKVDVKLAKLRRDGMTDEVKEALRQKRDEYDARDVETRAITMEGARQTGSNHVEFGGPDTQRWQAKVAAKPPSASDARRDARTCSYCQKSSTTKLQVCSRCKIASYCNGKCQKSAWKGHKMECRPRTAPEDAQKKENKAAYPVLPLTWKQLEAFKGDTATGELLEVPRREVCVSMQGSSRRDETGRHLHIEWEPGRLGYRCRSAMEESEVSSLHGWFGWCTYRRRRCGKHHHITFLIDHTVAHQTRDGA
eukprot:TRINITY_DN5466_c0_g1_i1.p1 TRINITY_DN5466_c0_g1~~TRINITY_DN5466_c0_g1_i1.p1  ORF type:complete len:338 (+),score=53.12 TRINITY_DN5466_c0_g1_i1:162-1175(+)